MKVAGAVNKSRVYTAQQGMVREQSRANSARGLAGVKVGAQGFSRRGQAGPDFESADSLELLEEKADGRSSWGHTVRPLRCKWPRRGNSRKENLFTADLMVVEPNNQLNEKEAKACLGGCGPGPSWQVWK